MQVGVLSIPFDSGRYRERMGLGPELLFREGIEPLLRRRGISYVHEELSPAQSFHTEIGSTFQLCNSVSANVRSLKVGGYVPILLTGNCDVAIGAICGCDPVELSVIWFDAHGEANTPETTQSGFLDGMGISILTGQCWRSLAGLIPGFQPVPGDRILLVGARDLEPEEPKLLDRIGVIRATGIANVRDALPSLARETSGCYLHFDLDVLDPQYATANQWTPSGGMSLEEILEILSLVRVQLPISGFGFASYDPRADVNRQALHAAVSITEKLLFGP
jgi:arginase